MKIFNHWNTFFGLVIKFGYTHFWLKQIFIIQNISKGLVAEVSEKCFIPHTGVDQELQVFHMELFHHQAQNHCHHCLLWHLLEDYTKQTKMFTYILHIWKYQKYTCWRKHIKRLKSSTYWTAVDGEEIFLCPWCASEQWQFSWASYFVHV